MRLYGKIPVLERLKSNPRSIKKIYIQDGNSELSYIRKKAHQWKIPCFCIAASQMAKMSRNINSQGILIEIEDFAYTPFDELLDLVLEKKVSFVFLDELNDPQNFGGIIRSLSCLGDFAVVIPTHESVEVTEAVLRVAAGGDNYVKVAKVNNLNQAILSAKRAGFCIAGAVVEGGQNLWEAQFSYPLALVIGSEQKGIRESVKKNLDMALSIPMAQPRMSMNVAHATAIFCYEITKQKK